jgi:hypothetical protein
MPATAEPAPSGRTRPPEITVLTGIVLLEALALAAAGLLLVWTLLFGEPLTVGGTVFLAVVFLGGALWLLRAGRGLWRGFRWPRAAALVVQLFLLVVAVPLFGAGRWAAALLPALPAAVGIRRLVRPAALAWTTRTLR